MVDAPACYAAHFVPPWLAPGAGDCLNEATDRSPTCRRPGECTLRTPPGTRTDSGGPGTYSPSRSDRYVSRRTSRRAGKHARTRATRTYGTDHYRSTIPAWYAMTTSWTRSRAPSFIRILDTCVFAVSGLRCNACAISALVSPVAIRPRTSRSRLVNSSKPSCSFLLDGCGRET